MERVAESESAKALRRQAMNDESYMRCQWTTLILMIRRAEINGYCLGEYVDVGQKYPANAFLAGRRWFKAHFKLDELNFAPPGQVEQCIQKVEHQLECEEREQMSKGMFNKGINPRFDVKAYKKLNAKLEQYKQSYEKTKGQNTQFDIMSKMPIQLIETQLAFNSMKLTAIGAWQNAEKANDLLERLNTIIQKVSHDIADKVAKPEDAKSPDDYKGDPSNMLEQYVHGQDKIRFHRHMRLTADTFSQDILIQNKLLDYSSREMLLVPSTEDGEPTDRLLYGLQFLEKRTDVFRKVLLKKDNPQMTALRNLYEKIHRSDKISSRHILLTDAKCLGEALNGHWNYAGVADMELCYFNLVHNLRIGS